MRDYADLVRSLTEVHTAETRAIAVVGAEFAAGAGAAEAEVTAADHVVRQAEAAVLAAQRGVRHTDERSRRLWAELAALLGWRGRRLGGVPAAAPDPSATSSARTHLDRAAATIARAAVGEPVAPVPRRLIPLLPPAGAIAALLAILLIRGIAAITTVHPIAPILTFFAPFAGVPLLIIWARHRFGTTPDAGAIALTAIGGMIAACVAAVVF